MPRFIGRELGAVLRDYGNPRKKRFSCERANTHIEFSRNSVMIAASRCENVKMLLAFFTRTFFPRAFIANPPSKGVRIIGTYQLEQRYRRSKIPCVLAISVGFEEPLRQIGPF
ncbi:hypothetical protein [Rhodomicrobium vannielii]|uniref:hypothetical protein n=1 Tax=Rhodomicrobium vannielii TaxID=1069 RepID=UPI0002F87AF8|nr:hypothetical protein [Rhodomicrobium vannielii]